MNEISIVDPEGYFPHMHNLPVPLPIAELEADERWKAIPLDYQISEFHARGRNQVFDGREDEISRLLHAFQPRKEISDRTNNQTMLMYGAQGSGKSTLLEEIGTVLRANGVAAISLHRSAFTSKAEFIEQITGSKLWRSATKLQRIKDRVLSIVGDAITQTGMFALQQEAVKWGVNDTLSQWSLVLGAARLDTSPPATPAEVLQRLDDAFQGGFMITVDEIQHWHSEVGNTDLSYLVNLVGDPTERYNSANLRSGGLLLAGLADSVEVLRRLELTRVDHMRLGALEPLVTLDIMHDHLDRSEVELNLVQTVKHRWCMTMTNQFHSWPHHTVCAVRAMMLALENMHHEWRVDGYPEIKWENYEQQLDWARTVAARGVAKLYHERWSDAKRVTREGMVPDIVELANQLDNVVHEDAVYHLIAIHSESVRTSKRKSVDEYMTELLHSGLLEPVLDNKHTLTDFLRIPIPSMSHFIHTRTPLQANGDQVAAAIKQIPSTAVPPTVTDVLDLPSDE